jgi:hypothetical protein
MQLKLLKSKFRLNPNGYSFTWNKRHNCTQRIREFDITTPIIALTAISLNENRDLLLSFGMDDVITKPFVPEVFMLLSPST